ncbi:MAG TPA: hypothetical protein VF322_00515 [Gammaproteobacteria bacterium]
MKGDIRSLRDKIETSSASLNAIIDAVNAGLTVKIDALKDSLASAKIWALVLYIALSGSLFATLARGFGWV